MKNRPVMVSYWPNDLDITPVVIRHLSIEDAAFIAGRQTDLPSACVWLIPNGPAWDSDVSKGRPPNG